VLLVVQFPISDARPFTPGLASRLDLPDWPSPTTEISPQFVRRFGPAVRRRRGPDAAWIAEKVFCQANGALKFSGLGEVPLGPEDIRRRSALRRQFRPPVWKFQPVCALRRLLSDGSALVRVEIGVAHSSRATRLRGIEGDELYSIVRDFLDLPTRVMRADDNPTGGPLILQGRHLAELYERASTRLGAQPSRGRSGLVESGMPLVLVEFGRGEVKRLPRGVQSVDAAKVHGANLAFAWIKTAKATVPAWFVTQGRASSQELRSLRLSLLRLHAEREALDLVLRQLRRGRVTFDPRTNESETLQAYLNRATRVVERDWVSGVSQSAILAAFDAAESVLRPEDRDELSSRLESARGQVLKKVAKYETTRAYVREIHALTYVEGDLVEHNEQIITGGTFTGPVINKVASEKIENSFQTVANSNSAPELKEALTLLADEVKLLVRQLEDAGGSPESIQDVADLLETFATQAIRDRPLKAVLQAAGKALVDGAQAVAERVAPIAGAVSAVLKLLGMAAIL
jgi:hypothetical protein